MRCFGCGQELHVQEDELCDSSGSGYCETHYDDCGACQDGEEHPHWVRLVAHFHPQAWVRDNAIEVDPEGPVEWDCTNFVDCVAPGYRSFLLAHASEPLGALDRWDALKDDPDAPEWVRAWSGPFDIRVRDAEQAAENTYTFVVTVTAPTREHAEQVMSERISPDEDYGFDYRIDWAPRA